jgi:uncharacterized membrane protein YdjX (TVP38/TMEM64 family)
MKGNSLIPYRAITLFLLVTAFVLIPFFLFGEKIDLWFAKFVEVKSVNPFFVAAVLYALLALDIILPVPSCLVGVACGYFLGPVYGWSVSFLSMSTSAAIGYMLGYYFSDYAKKLVGKKDFSLLKCLHTKYSSILLLSLRSVPVLAEASVLFAGITKTAITDFALQVSVGNAIVSFVYVATGILFSMKSEYSFIAFSLCVAASAVFIICRSRLK